MTTTTAQIVIGTRVHTGLYGRGFGVVYAVNGEQGLDWREIAPGVRTNSGASFDVVFENGGRSQNLSERTLRGVQWDILADQPLADEIEIAGLLAAAAAKEANDKAAETIAKQNFADAVQNFKTSPDYAHLTQKQEGDRDDKTAVANIRKELKAKFPGVKFSVTNRDYGTVNIRWEDGPFEKEVEAVTNSYSGGSFDGMTDSYEYSRSPFTEVFGSARYIFTSRSSSEALQARAVATIAKEYAGNLKEQGIELTFEGFKRGDYRHVWNFAGGRYTLQDLIWQQVHETK